MKIGELAGLYLQYIEVWRCLALLYRGPEPTPEEREALERSKWVRECRSVCEKLIQAADFDRRFDCPPADADWVAVAARTELIECLSLDQRRELGEFSEAELYDMDEPEEQDRLTGEQLRPIMFVVLNLPRCAKVLRGETEVPGWERPLWAILLRRINGGMIVWSEDQKRIGDFEQRRYEHALARAQDLSYHKELFDMWDRLNSAILKCLKELFPSTPTGGRLALIGS